MKRFYVVLVVALASVGLTAGSASAQRFESKVIDTEKLVVKPTDTATNILGGATRYVSRVVAGTLDNNGIVKTLNNLFSRKDYGPQVQGGLSPLPPVTSYPSTYFNSPIKPVQPKYMTIQR